MAPRKKTDVIVSQSEVTSFENTKQLFIELADQVTQIKVTDTTSLAIANQKMSNVNNHLKEIEAKRVEQKAPFLEGAKKVDEVAKELKSLLEPALKHLKTEVANWETERIRKENELKQKALEVARKTEEEAAAIANDKRIVDYIAQVKEWLEKGLTACNTVEHGNQMLSSMQGLQPAALMGKYSQEYSALVEMYKTLFNTKVGELTGSVAPGTTDKHIEVLGGQLNNHIESIKQEVESKQVEVAQVETQIQQEMNSLQEDKVNNVRYNWKFELLNINEVPLEWLTVDEAKVKEWIKANKENLKEGSFNGINFFKEMTVVTR